MNKNKFKLWLDNPDHCLIMGIINMTPDSFSDGGKFNSINSAIDYAYKLLDTGADILDIGGESSRPGADPVSNSEEIDRISPLIKELGKNANCLISVDTYKSSTAKFGLDNGATIINDISGLTHDSEMASVISNFNAAVVVMHMKGTPKTMQKNPNYFDLIKEIKSFFSKQIEFAIKNGINRKNIILDPGIGFGKGLNDNFEIIGKLDQICDMGYPVLVGPSRKSFIGEVLNLSVNERLEGSLAAANACLMNGAKIIRVHDVNETKKSLSIIEKIIGSA